MAVGSGGSGRNKRTVTRRVWRSSWDGELGGTDAWGGVVVRWRGRDVATLNKNDSARPRAVAWSEGMVAAGPYEKALFPMNQELDETHWTDPLKPPAQATNHSAGTNYNWLQRTPARAMTDCYDWSQEVKISRSRETIPW
ncbi:MAG: hypothetical protein M1813_002536 [Trichoglossum hirsutum]|jgi:hypothetical protein|nr:MAG: hypothetical protein M1813_002536 [Trichoglossum hirsutum]